MILILSSIAGLTFLAAKMKKAKYSTTTIGALIILVIAVLAVVIGFGAPSFLAALSQIVPATKELR